MENILKEIRKECLTEEKTKDISSAEPLSVGPIHHTVFGTTQKLNMAFGDLKNE